MSRKLIINTDGASRGNPGPAAVGVVIRNEQGETIQEISEAIGEATNNVAEYRAVIKALEAARRLSPEEVEVRVDSELLVQQLTGGYRIKSPLLMPLAVQARSLLNTFAKAEIRHLPRNDNARADQLANAALGPKPGAAGKAAPGASRGRKLTCFFSTHTLEWMEREQVEALINGLKSDPLVKVVRIAADTIERKMVCEFQAACKEDVIDLLARHSVRFDWLLTAGVDENA